MRLHPTHTVLTFWMGQGAPCRQRKDSVAEEGWAPSPTLLTGGETEAQRGQKTYPGSHRWSEAKLACYPASHSSQSNGRRGSGPASRDRAGMPGLRAEEGQQRATGVEVERLQGCSSTGGGICSAQDPPWLQCGQRSGEGKSSWEKPSVTNSPP